MFLGGALLFLNLSLRVVAVDVDASLDWKTVESSHFKLHYVERDRAIAERIYPLMEPAFQALQKKFGSAPGSQIQLVISDSTDEPNGLSTPIPYNTIYLWPHPPDANSSLDGYDDWLRMLLTHELTHTFHLDQAFGLNRLFRWIIGRAAVPNAAQQQWALEGLAEFNETSETGGGRGRSDFVEMFLRTVSLEKKFAGIERATYWNDFYPFGNSAYWYGIGFYQYLSRIYGPEKIFEWTRQTATSPFPAFHHFKSRSIFGKSLSRLWAEWKQESLANAAALAGNAPSQFKFEAIGDHRRLLAPAVWNGSDLLSYQTDRDQARLFAINSKTGQIRRRWKLPSGPLQSFKLIPNTQKIVYSAIAANQPGQEFLDIFNFDLETGHETRMSEKSRVRDLVVDKDFVYAVQAEGLQSRLVRMSLAADHLPFVALDQRWEVLYQAPGEAQIFNPSVFGSKIVFTIRDEKGQVDLYQIDTAQAGRPIQRLTQSAEMKRQPQWIREGTAVLFVQTSKTALKNGNTFVAPQLAILDLKTMKTEVISDLLTGAWFPVPSPDGKTIAFGNFESRGFSLATARLAAPAIAADSMSGPATPNFLSTPPVAAGESPRLKNLPAAHSYSEPATLLPHYWVPFFFYTESDAGILAFTGSQDPIAKHTYSLFGLYLLGPNRPGGAFSYSYNGIKDFTFATRASAEITDYGAIVLSTPSGDVVGDYYERLYTAEGAVIFSPSLPPAFPGVHLSTGLRMEAPQPLLGLPSGTREGFGSYTNSQGATFSNIQLSPDRGLSWGPFARFTLGKAASQRPQAITPERGWLAHLDFESHLPSAAGSERPSLTTLGEVKGFYGWDAGAQGVAALLTAGAQWFDPPYLNTFRLGGSTGESPVSQISRRSFLLRGLADGQLRGEEVLALNLEYRFRLLSDVLPTGLAPIWPKNLYIALFGDAGQIFNREQTTPNLIYAYSNGAKTRTFDWQVWEVATGAEIRSDISLLYAPPISFRLGYGRVALYHGHSAFSQNMSQFYFQAGASF